MDKYEQIRHLADGGFGKAYLYERKNDNNKFVIKVINAHSLTAQETTDSFREVQVLKKLAHPGIVKFEDAFKDAGNICIVMEFCEAGDLFSRISAGDNISEKQKWDWFVQICVALKYMHSCRVIHRDLKPSNVFISQDGNLRLGDFGLSKIFTHSGSLMNSTQGGCTISYGSPEMLDTGKFTAKSDVWSLGCVLYFMVMRKVAFDGKGLGQIIKAVCLGEYAPIPDSYSANFRDMVAKLLTVDPDDRPSIAEVLEVPYVKAVAEPAQRLKNVYGYALKDGVLRDGNGDGFTWNRYVNPRDNNLRFEGMAEIMTEQLYDTMMEMGFIKLPVPVEPGADSEPLGTFILATDNWEMCEQLLILIHGSGQVKAGQWAQRVMMTASMETGTQLPYIRQAVKLGYGVMVLNTNDNRPDIDGCKSPVDHGLYVWEHYVKESAAVQVAIKAHSAGGSITSALYKKYGADFKRRVYVNAFTGVDPVNVPVEEYTKKVTRNWVTSDKAVGTVVSSDRCECVSAGTTKHSETPHYAIDKVFEFIAERFGDRTPGNL